MKSIVKVGAVEKLPAEGIVGPSVLLEVQAGIKGHCSIHAGAVRRLRFECIAP